MIQPNHCGAYEYLWSEHKYSILSVGIKPYQNAGGKLGKNPQITSFLNNLYTYSQRPQSEWYSAILSAYNHIKPMLSRSEKFQIISTILKDKSEAKELIYSKIIEYKEKSLPGCRIFFKRDKALYKFWDKDDHPGLWLCFGPFQVHLSPTFIIKRAVWKTKLSHNTIMEYLHQLQQITDIDTFNKWPQKLQNYLIDNNMVVLPGQSARLHYRVPLSFPTTQEDLTTSSPMIAALIQEKVWDTSVDETTRFPQLVDYNTFKTEFNHKNFEFLKWPSEISIREAYDFLINMFYTQKQIEANQS